MEWLKHPVVWAVIAVAFLGAMARFWYWRGQVDADRSTFKTTLDAFMVEIRDDIKWIFERLPPAVTSRSSPIRLTDLGKAVSKRLDARGIAEKLAPLLRDRVTDKQPHEIQEICSDYIVTEHKPPRETEILILACAYENAINRSAVLEVPAIELRDVVLASMVQSGSCQKTPA